MKIINFPFRVKEEIVRGVALQVFLGSLFSIIFQSIIPVYVLFLDFFIRAVVNPGFSPLVKVSQRIQGFTHYRKRLVTFKPKRFAAFIGLTMTGVALVLFSTGLVIPGVIVMSILALFSFLESFFKFCAGCKIFALLIKVGIFSEELCEDCLFEAGGGI